MLGGAVPAVDAVDAVAGNRDALFAVNLDDLDRVVLDALVAVLLLQGEVFRLWRILADGAAYINTAAMLSTNSSVGAVGCMPSSV